MNKKALWALVIVVVVIVIISLVASRKPASTDSGQAIKIGADLSLSGIASTDGESIKNGLELARADLKAKGVNVDIEYQDDKTDSKDTVSAINALSVMGVQAIIGPTWSYLADSGVPVASSLKIVTVMPANTSEYVNAHTPYAFFTTAKVALLSAPLADWLKQSHKARIAIIRNQGSWYDVVDKAVIAAATQAGAKVVYEESIPFGAAQSSLATIMAKVKLAKPDLIFTEIDEDEGIVTFFKKTNELQINADVMSVTTSLGRILASGNIHLNQGNSLYLIAPQTSDAFNAKYKAAYGTDAKPYADRAYDSLMLLVDAIQHHGDMPLNDYLHSKTDYKGFLGQYKFDANNDISEGTWIVRKLQ